MIGAFVAFALFGLGLFALVNDGSKAFGVTALLAGVAAGIIVRMKVQAALRE